MAGLLLANPQARISSANVRDSAALRRGGTRLAITYARRRRFGRNDARGGLGRTAPTVHSCAHNVQRHSMTRLPCWRVTSASRVHTELAAHSGHGDFIACLFVSAASRGSAMASATRVYAMTRLRRDPDPTCGEPSSEEAMRLPFAIGGSTTGSTNEVIQDSQK